MPTKNAISFPEETIDVILDLIKKYNLEKTEKDMEKKMKEVKTDDDLKRNREIFESLPSCQISRTLKEAAEGKISVKDIPSLLKERLNISKEKAEDLTEDLKEKIIKGIETTKREEEIPLKKEKAPPRTDVYREPIE